MSTTEEPVVTTTEKFDLLIKDFNTLMDTTKSLTARMRVLQKEVVKCGLKELGHGDIVLF